MKLVILIILAFKISCSTENEKKVWNYLKKEGLTGAGAASLMGNLKAESNMQSISYENTYKSQLNLTDQKYVDCVNNETYKDFITDKIGFGLSQWAYMGDLECKLCYLIYELTNDYE